MTSTLQLNLNEALRLMRERADLDQKRLADILEIGRTSVIRYESGAVTPRWRIVEAWALACDHDPAAVRELWEGARESGCIYGTIPLFDPGALAFRDQRGKFRTPVAPTRPPVVGDEGNRAA